MKNVLITGGAGFIGSHLSNKLVNLGYNVTVLDNLSTQIHGRKRDSFLYRSINNNVKFILGDVRKKSDLRKAIKNQAIIFHLAAETGTTQSMMEISKYTSVNTLGTANLLEILLKENHSIKKIILASSRSVYGEGKYICKKDGIIFPDQRNKNHLDNGIFEHVCPLCNKKLIASSTDEKSKINPLSIYAITKYQQEQLIFKAGDILDLPVVVLRYQNVYGPGQSLTNPYTGILSVFSTRILNHNNLEIYEDGNESRDFVFIDDVINANILSLKEEANNHIFNVGSGNMITINKVANVLKTLYNCSSEILITGKYRLGDIRHNYADITKIKSILGFYPSIDFQTGVAKFVDWVKTQNISKDKYQNSVRLLKEKGLIR